MINRFILPAPSLRRYIRHYQLCHFTFSGEFPTPIKSYPACPEEGFSFFLRGQLQTECPDLNKSEKRAKTAIFGLPDYRQNFVVPNDFMLLHACFQPGALYKFLGIPMPDLVHQAVDAELVLGAEIRSLSDQLANTTTYDELPHLLDQFFWKKANQITVDTRPIDHIGLLLLSNPFAFRLEKLASEACLSPRAFEKRFMQQVGVTPKYFARICRFAKAFKQKEHQPNTDWLSLSIQNGYTDYQHLAKDFKQFGGVTPTQLIQQTALDPEHLLGIQLETRESK